jgi:hypothetical protein
LRDSNLLFAITFNFVVISFPPRLQLSLAFIVSLNFFIFISKFCSLVSSLLSFIRSLEPLSNFSISRSLWLRFNSPATMWRYKLFYRTPTTSDVNFEAKTEAHTHPHKLGDFFLFLSVSFCSFRILSNNQSLSIASERQSARRGKVLQLYFPLSILSSPLLNQLLLLPPLLFPFVLSPGRPEKKKKKT